MDKQDNPIFQRSYPNAEMCNQKLKELPIFLMRRVIRSDSF